MLRLAITLCCILLTSGALAQRLATALSDIDISIHSNFDGETLTLFGNIEPPLGATERVVGPFNVVIVVEGPPATHTVRQQTRQLGIWLNSNVAQFAHAPGYYQVLSSNPITELADIEILDAARIRFDQHAFSTKSGPDQTELLRQLERLMAAQNLFGVNDRGVQFLSETFYRARLELPANVPSGAYLAKTFLFSDGQIIENKSTRFIVHTSGFGRFLERSAQDYPWAYGLAAVVLALFTGWLGSVVFRR